MPCLMAALISGESVVASRIVPAPTPILATRAMSAVSEFTRPLFHGIIAQSMSLISLTIQHGQTQNEARRRLETAVHDISTKFGAMLRRVEWAADRNRKTLFPRLPSTGNIHFHFVLRHFIPLFST